jgi:Uma2 family endonuclease
MASRIEPLMSVDQLDALPDDGNRYELIEGELFVSRAPGIPHQRVLLNLEIALSTYLAGNPIGILVPGAGVVFSDYDAVIPDLVFVRREHWDRVVANDRFVAAPDLLIEIVSSGEANRARDLVAKRRLYGKYCGKEYWIVDLENRSIMVFLLEGEKLEQVAKLTDEDEVTSLLFPGLRLKVSRILDL